MEFFFVGGGDSNKMTKSQGHWGMGGCDNLSLEKSQDKTSVKHSGNIFRKK